MVNTNEQQNRSANKNRYKMSKPLDATINDMRDKNKIKYLETLE